MTRWGTSHFESLAAAESYYRCYGITKDNVGLKITDGEIHVGKPEVKEGQRLGLDEDRRYWIEESEQNNCDGSGPHMLGEVHVMPTGGDGNLILCRQCWENELAYRRDRNRSLGVFAQFDTPAWNDAKVYEAV